jgi:GDP-L-fucose synthase
MDQASRIFVAGHRGLVGSAIVRALRRQGFHNIQIQTRAETDLSSKEAVDRFFEAARPEYVFLAAAKVGGIMANSTYPVDFLRDNLLIELNVVESAWRHGAKKLESLGSSCIYPKLAPQPLKEEYLLTGALEPTNEWYAVAKIAGIKLCQAYRLQHGFNAISLMPTNLYGPGDNFDLQNSHVLPAMIRRFHEAKLEGKPEVTLWGTGKPRREFMHVDDLAEAAIFLMQNYNEAEIVNVGVGDDVTIADLAKTVAAVVGYSGKISYDASKPDGTPRKLMDVTRLHAMGWRHKTELEDGIRATYQWFCSDRRA